jgi:hypothetical protein
MAAARSDQCFATRKFSTQYWQSENQKEKPPSQRAPGKTKEKRRANRARRSFVDRLPTITFQRGTTDCDSLPPGRILQPIAISEC